MVPKVGNPRRAAEGPVSGGSGLSGDLDPVHRHLPGAAVLDPFQATVDVGGPFGTIVQDRTLRLSPGRSDTARIALAAPGSDILARLIGLAFSPPDSVRIHGSARVPGLLFGTSEMPFRFAAPWSEIAPRFQGLLHGGN